MGSLLHQTLGALVKAAPASGSRKASAEEIADALQLSKEDRARFIPLVLDASISALSLGGEVTLSLREEFRFRPHPDGRDLVFKTAFSGNVFPGRLEVVDGLQAVVGFARTNIKRIEDATENGVAGVRVIAGLGTEFYPI